MDTLIEGILIDPTNQYNICREIFLVENHTEPRSYAHFNILVKYD